MEPVSSVRDLGVHLDADMSIDTHITQLVCSYFDILRQIRCIRRSLYNVHRITAFILSKADLTIVMSHCRACWIVTLSEYSRSSMLLLVLRLELVNTTMSRRPILVACTWTHNLQVVSSFIHVKLFYRIVSYKCLHGTAPSYLQDVIQPVAVNLAPSSPVDILVRPGGSGIATNYTIGDRVFAVAGPRAWMEQPSSIRHRLHIFWLL